MSLILRGTVVFWLLAFTTLQLHAQIYGYENPISANPPATVSDAFTVKVETIPADVQARLDRRQENFYFFNTMRIISEPSIISPLVNYTYNVTGDHKKPFILDANIRTPIAVGGKRFRMFTIHFMPEFQIRIFNEYSLPVRTPSTIPGAYVYWSPARMFKRQLWDPKEERIGPLKNPFIGARVFHHSNGQDQPEINPVTNRVNTYNGNFSELAVFEILVGSKFNTQGENIRGDASNKEKVAENLPGKQVRLKTYKNWNVFWKLGYEFHPASFSDSVFRVYNNYARYRVNFAVGGMFIQKLWEVIGDGKMWYGSTAPEPFERVRLTITGSYTLGDYYSGDVMTDLHSVDALDISKRLNICATAYWVLGFTKSSALFGQVAYYGTDNYNIYFNQSIWNFRAGLALGFFNQPEVKDKKSKI